MTIITDDLASHITQHTHLAYKRLTAIKLLLANTPVKTDLWIDVESIVIKMKGKNVKKCWRHQQKGF